MNADQNRSLPVDHDVTLRDGSTAHLRRARLDDAEPLWRLGAAVVRAGRGVVLAPDEIPDSAQRSAESIESLSRDKGHLLLVATVADELAGTIDIRRLGPVGLRHVGLLTMGVHPDWQGKGLGRALLDGAVAWADASGIDRIELFTLADNRRAQSLYRSAGFVEVWRRGDFYRPRPRALGGGDIAMVRQKPADDQLVVGVDGWRKGWVAVALRGGVFAGATTHERFAGALAEWPEADRIGVDIPIGLLDRGEREADRAAKAFLRGRASTVFPVPPRDVLLAPTHAEAVKRANEIMGKGISVQSYGLRHRILEVDRWVSDERVVEVHPEVSFQLLAGEALPSKKSWGGQSRRRQALVEARIVIPPQLGDAGTVPPDDLLDAAAVAWTARRYDRGEARSFPTEVAQVDRGRPVAIWG